MRLQVDFVSNLPLSEKSGGWSGISASLFEQVSTFGDTRLIGPINPRPRRIDRAWGLACKNLGFRRPFSFFSEERLGRIALEYDMARSEAPEYVLFHGATPWLKCHPRSPYGAYVDASFKTYLEVFHASDKFNPSDVERIAHQEQEWLNGADHVYWGSQWALDRAVADTNVGRSNAHVVWVGGNAPIPDSAPYPGGLRFLFISLDFERKGGGLAVEALQVVRSSYPSAELVVLGERPPPVALSAPGVSYGGFLRKTVPDELAEFVRHLASARALVHPTMVDTMGMVLIEAAYYGCPSISARLFGVPELVLDGETGYLLDAPFTVAGVAARMLALCEESPVYYAMRRAARMHALRNLTWDAVGERLRKAIVDTCAPYSSLVLHQ